VLLTDSTRLQAIFAQSADIRLLLQIIQGERMKLGIIGLGILGGTYYTGYKHLGYDVVGYDKYKRSDVDKVKKLFDCDAIFICLPTICDKNENTDLSPFEDVLPQLRDYRGVIFMRSTMMPGQTAYFNKKYHLNMLHCPEFLTEKNAKMDFFKPSRILIGMDGTDLDDELVNQLFGIFNVPIIYGMTVETELAKIASNVALAVKITFANEFDKICKINGTEWEFVKTMIIDDRINTKYMNVTEEGGYSGMCLPKDTKQIIQDSIKKGYAPWFLKEVDKSNTRFRTKE
jgi:nucleotide sugar dehydrogenase